MKKKGFFIFVIEFLIFWIVAEGINHVLSIKIGTVPYLYVPLLFLAVKISYDLYNVVFFKEKLFSYIEDYVKDILTVLLISILAGGIAYITDTLIKGNVRTTVLAAIAVLYLTKNK